MSSKKTENEMPFQMLFDSSPNGIAIYKPTEDGHNFVFVDMNRVGLEFADVTREQVIGKKITDCFPGVEESGILAALRRVAETGKTELVPLVQYQDERIEQWVENKIFKLPSGLVVAIFNDVTEMRTTQAELAEAELRQRQTVAAGQVGLWDWDLTENTVHYSAEWKRQIGYEDHEISDSFDEWRSRVHPDDLKPVEKQIEDFIKAKQSPYKLEFRFQHKNGSWRWILAQAEILLDEEDNPIRVLGSHIDITERKQTEHALEESEEKYRALFNNAPLPYQSLNEDGCFIDVNPAWLRILGYDREEVVGKWFGDFLHPDFVQHFKKNFPAFKKRGYVKDVQFRIRHKNGTYLHIEFEGCIGYLPDGSFRQTYCVFMDITERKQMETALKNSEELLNETAMTAKVGGWEIDLSADTLTWTDETFHIHEVNRSEQPTLKEAINYYHPDDRCRVKKAVQTAVETGEPFDFEARLITKRGNLKWVHAKGSAVFENGEEKTVRGIVQDITERKTAEEALREKEQRYRGLIELTGDAMTIHDQSGRIIDVNDYACAHFGYTREELLQMTIADLDPDADDRNDRGTLWNNELYHPIVFETRHKKKNGDIFHAEVRHSMVRHNGATVGLGFSRDITERKLTEEELANYRADLEEKVDERTEDLRTIVNAMAGREVRMAELKEVIATLREQLEQAGIQPASDDLDPE